MNQKLILAIVTIVLGLVVPGYLLMSKGDGTATDTDVVTSSAPSSEAEVVFRNLIAQLTPLTFDTSIGTDPRFTSLVDLHTAIIPEQKGRRDPFAAFGK